MSLGAFTFAGTASSDMRLLVGEKTIYNGPERDIERIEIPGMNGDLLLDNGRYRNVEVGYTCYVMPGDAKLVEACRAIKAWLYGAGTGYHVLADTYDSGYFRQAAYHGTYDVEEWAIEIGYVPIVFDCKPEKYSFAGQVAQGFSDSGSITNPEGFPSKPLIRVYGNDTGVLYINDLSMVITAISDYVDIDCETQNAYKGTINKNSTITLNGFGFPRLAPGNNLFAWGGGIQSIEITPRWWTL